MFCPNLSFRLTRIRSYFLTITALAMIGAGGLAASRAGAHSSLESGTSGSAAPVAKPNRPLTGCAGDGWIATNSVGAPDPRYGQTAVWTGTEMIVWGTQIGYINTGARYNPATDSWTPTTITGAPSPR